MSSIYSGSRKDVYDYLRCPKILAAKAYSLLRQIPIRVVPQARETKHIRKVRATAVRLIFEGSSPLTAIQQVKSVTRLSMDELGKVTEFIFKTEKLRRKLTEEYGEIIATCKGMGKHPDLAEYVQPDLIAYVAHREKPFIIEVKSTCQPDAMDVFQARFYNALASESGVYVLNKRRENEMLNFSPRLVKGNFETVLIYPSSESYSVIKEKADVNSQLVHDVWRTKQLGFRGLAPETDCSEDCPHRKLKVKLREGDMEPLPPLPLMFARGVTESGYNLDINYQVAYACETLRTELSQIQSDPNVARDMLIGNVGLDPEAVDIALGKRGRYSCQPTAEDLLRSIRYELKPWRRVLGSRATTSAAPYILGLGLHIYGLPNGSTDFVRRSWDEWHS